MLAENINTALVPNREFTKLASNEQIERTAEALGANGMLTYIAENGEEAKRIVLDLIPQGSGSLRQSIANACEAWHYRRVG